MVQAWLHSICVRSQHSVRTKESLLLKENPYGLGDQSKGLLGYARSSYLVCYLSLLVKDALT